MLLEKGQLASIAAYFDRMVTKVSMEKPMEVSGNEPRSRGERTKLVFHPRKDGLQALVRLPNQKVAIVDNKTIVHSYDSEGKLIYRKRINDEPKGLEVDSELSLPSNGWEFHKFLERRQKELGWIEE